jgi:hypothetical protein
MALRLRSIRIPGREKRSRGDDPYWDFFINTPPADLANTVTELIRTAPEGNVFPTKADVHTPEVTSTHVKELARYLGADLVGIARLDLNAHSGVALTREGQDSELEVYRFGVICVIRADCDPRRSPGIGGQVPVQNGLFITFVLSAWIRELGYRATALEMENAEGLAAQARLGTVNADGKLVTAKFGSHVHVARVICTDLPLAPDG